MAQADPQKLRELLQHQKYDGDGGESVSDGIAQGECEGKQGGDETPLKCLVTESLAPSRGLAVVFKTRVQRGQKAWNALRVAAKTLAVFLVETEFFGPHEAKQKNRFAKEHERKSEDALKRAQREDEKKIGKIMRVPDIAERPGDGESRAIRVGARWPIGGRPGQEARANCCEQRRQGIQNAHEHVLLRNSVIPGNNGVKDIEMIEVVERIGGSIDERHHPEAMARLKFGSYHAAPLECCWWYAWRELDVS